MESSLNSEIRKETKTLSSNESFQNEKKTNNWSVPLEPWNFEDFQFTEYLEELHLYFEEEFLNFVGGVEIFFKFFKRNNCTFC